MARARGSSRARGRAPPHVTAGLPEEARRRARCAPRRDQLAATPRLAVPLHHAVEQVNVDRLDEVLVRAELDRLEHVSCMSSRAVTTTIVGLRSATLNRRRHPEPPGRPKMEQREQRSPKSAPRCARRRERSRRRTLGRRETSDVPRSIGRRRRSGCAARSEDSMERASVTNRDGGANLSQSCGNETKLTVILTVLIGCVDIEWTLAEVRPRKRRRQSRRCQRPRCRNKRTVRTPRDRSAQSTVPANAHPSAQRYRARHLRAGRDRRAARRGAQPRRDCGRRWRPRA